MEALGLETVLQEFRSNQNKELLEALLIGTNAVNRSDSIEAVRKLLKFRGQILLTALECIRDDNVGREWIALLEAEVESLEPKIIHKVVDIIVSSVENGNEGTSQLVQLLPKTVNQIIKTERLNKPNEDSALDKWLNRLCGCEWDQDALTIAQALVDINLEGNRIQQVMEKILLFCKSSSCVDLLPQLARILLTANCSKQKDVRRRILQGLVDVFVVRRNRLGRHDNEGAEKLMEIEGLVVQALLANTLSQSQSINTDWLKTIKNGVFVASPLCVAFILVLLGAEALKVQVQKALKEEEQLLKSEWLSQIPFSKQPSSNQLLEAVMKVGSYDGNGWDSLMDQLCQIAYLGLDSVNIKSQDSMDFRRLAAQVSQNKVWMHNDEATSLRLANFCMELLVTVFTEHSEQREAVLNTCCYKISEHTPINALLYVALLSRLVKERPRDVAQHVLQVKEFVQTLNYLQSSVGVGLLVSLWPLCRLNVQIQEDVMNSMREMMLSRDLSTQMTAVHSFLAITVQELQLKQQQDMQVDMSDVTCSQSLSQIASLSTGSNVNLLTELLGFFRRCLKSTAPVRQAVYRGLTDITSLDETCYEAVADLLLPQFNQIARQGGQPRLELTALSTMQGTQVRQLEAAQDLFQSVYDLLCKSKQEEDDSPVKELRSSFYELREKLLRQRKDDFAVDTSFDLTTTNGLKYFLKLDAHLGILEVFVHSLVDECQQDTDQNEADVVGGKLERAVNLHQQLYEMGLVGNKGTRKIEAQQQIANETIIAKTSLTNRYTTLPVPVLIRLLKAIMTKGLIQSENPYNVSTPLQSTPMIPAKKQTPTKMPSRGRPKTGASEAIKRSQVQTPYNTPGPSERDRMQVEEGGDVTAVFEKFIIGPHQRLAVSSEFKAFLLRSALSYVMEQKGGVYGSSVIIGSCSNPDRLPNWLLSPPSITVAPYLLAASRAILISASSNSVQDQVSQLAARCVFNVLAQCQNAQDVEHVVSKLPGSDVSSCSKQRVEKKLERLKKLVIRLADSKMGNELWLVVEGILQISKYVPSDMRRIISRWPQDVGRYGEQQMSLASRVGLGQVSVEHEGISCTLTQLFVELSGIQDLVACSDVLIQTKKSKGEEQGQERELVFVSKKCGKIVAFVLQHIEKALLEVGCLISMLKQVQATDWSSTNVESQNLEEGTYGRLKQILGVLCLLFCLSENILLNQNMLFQVCISFYNQLAAFADVYTLKGLHLQVPIDKFQELVDSINQHITPKIYDSLRQIDELAKRKTSRQHKSIPELIYAIEQYERVMLELGKTCKKNLMRFAKRSTNRDFKIDLKKVTTSEQTQQHVQQQPTSN